MSAHADGLRATIRQLADNEHGKEFADMSEDARRARLYALADRVAHDIASLSAPAEAPVGVEAVRAARGEILSEAYKHVGTPRRVLLDAVDRIDVALAKQPAAVGGAFFSVFHHLANAYDVASKAQDGAAMHCHAEAMEALREAVASVQTEVQAALRELDSVTAHDDQTSDAIGCAENALERALATIAGQQGGRDDG